MAIQFAKAARHSVKLKIGIDGPSGSGKTMGALALAHGITKGGRIAVADSENGSASLYADRYEFDTVAIPDANPKTYREIITAAAAAEYDALVIDSLTHAWQFVLNAKDDFDRANPKTNNWTNWRKFAPLWEDLMKDVLHAPLHVIATMRSKQAYEQVQKDGRAQVVKLGLQPQVRDGAEYEFGLVFSVNQSHRAEATKDRTALFADRMLDLCDDEVHKSLVGWMNDGGPEPEQPGRATAEQLTTLRGYLDNGALGDDAKDTLRKALSRGMTAEKASDWLTRIASRLEAYKDEHTERSFPNQQETLV